MKLPETELTGNLGNSFWWLVGRWLADGHIGTRGDLFISVGEHKQNEFERKSGERVGPAMRTNTALQYRVRNDTELLSVILQCGRGAENKRLPGAAFSLDKERAESLLDGYLSGDGHYNEDRKRWYATSVSRELLLGIAFLFQRVHGEVASISAGRPAGTTTIEGRTVITKQEWILSSGGISHSFSWVGNDGAWKRVKAVDESGTSRVWNLRVDEDESYTAEGMIVKNCPMQFDIVNRLIVQLSNEGDVVFDPFGGLMTVPYCAIKLGRFGMGIELNQGYWSDGVRYCESASAEANVPTLFGMLDEEENEDDGIGEAEEIKCEENEDESEQPKPVAEQPAATGATSAFDWGAE